MPKFFMVRLLVGLWVLFSVNLLEAEEVLISGRFVSLGTYIPPNPSTGMNQMLFLSGGYYYTSGNTSYPFHLTNSPVSPDIFFVTQEEYNQSMGTRFLDVIGIPETMITDTFTNAFGFQQSVERPFFDMIDTEALIGLDSWSWDGQVYHSAVLIDPQYPIPSSAGTFNQAEQRFYVSDGRQYQVVPEPSSLSLLVAGGVVLMAGRRRKQD